MRPPRIRLNVRTVLKVLADLGQLASLALRSHAHLAAENLFLRRRLALYLERQARPRRADDATRITLVALSRLVDWRRLLVVVKPDTLMRWHRKGFRLFWRWKSKASGRPRIPADLQQLIAEMATDNRTWGEERIAAELLVKLGIHVSPRTVRRYMPPRSTPGARDGGAQAWSTFVRNHAESVLACDFFVTVTATFRVVYIFVVMEVGSRRIMHWNLTAHPTAGWTAQQFRMIVPENQAHRYVIHDRDSIYSEGVDRTLAAMGLTVLRTPVRAPQANACCERLVGTIRRECLDFVIPLNERHLREILKRDPPLQPRTATRELGSGNSRSTDRFVRWSVKRSSHSGGPSSGGDADLRRTPPRVSARAGRVRLGERFCGRQRLWGDRYACGILFHPAIRLVAVIYFTYFCYMTLTKLRRAISTDILYFPARVPVIQAARSC